MSCVKNALISFYQLTNCEHVCLYQKPECAHISHEPDNNFFDDESHLVILIFSGNLEMSLISAQRMQDGFQRHALWLYFIIRNIEVSSAHRSLGSSAEKSSGSSAGSFLTVTYCRWETQTCSRRTQQ